METKFDPIEKYLISENTIKQKNKAAFCNATYIFGAGLRKRFLAFFCTNLNPYINSAWSNIVRMVNVYIAVIQKEQGVTLHLQSAAKPHHTYYLLHITYYFTKIPLPILFWGKSEEVRVKR